MSFDDFKTITGKIRRHALRASLYDIGEPLLNKDIYKMIGHASANNISTLISTNFNLFREEHLDALFDSRLTVLEPCLDGFTQESYEKYRRGGQVDIVKNGISMVMERKRATGSRWPIVDAQVVEFDHIRDELKAIEGFLRQCDVDSITYRDESLGFNSPETTIAGAAPRRTTCFWLYVGMKIRPDGSVDPCCGLRFDGFAYGNLLEQDLTDIWNNAYYRFSRSLFLDGPDLDYDEKMRDVPCLSCRMFQPRRTMSGISS
jgi:MoaA/NifB/PqqE/SkfB family radical SAM enzyme